MFLWLFAKNGGIGAVGGYAWVFGRDMQRWAVKDARGFDVKWKWDEMVQYTEHPTP